MDRAELAQHLACSARRTMLTRPMPSAAQIRTSICPRLEAAAVWTSALWPSARIVSTIDSAVSGLMNSAAPSRGADVVGQLDDRCRVGDAVVSPHRPAEQRDATADQRGRFRARRDHGAGALVADRQRLVQPIAIQRERRLRDSAHEIRPVGRAACQGRPHPAARRDPTG